MDPAEAIAQQKRLASRVITRGKCRRARFIAGLDVGFSRDSRHAIGAAVVWDMAESIVIEERVAWRQVSFPYIPGLLSFRESPVLLTALECLRQQPDVLMCDGQGLAHPRRFGLACHMGVLTGLPAVGCAKSILVGIHQRLKDTQGSRTPLIHRDERVGEVVRTRTGVRPVYVSVGHKMDLGQAVELVLSCATRYRIPQPTRLADVLTKKAREWGPRWKGESGSLH